MEKNIVLYNDLVYGVDLYIEKNGVENMFTIADEINWTFTEWINKHPEATEEQMHKAFERIKKRILKSYEAHIRPV